MRLQCLIVESDPNFAGLIKSVLQEHSGIVVSVAANLHDTALNIKSHPPNLMFLRSGDDDLPYERVLKVLNRARTRTMIIPIVTKPTQNLLAGLLQEPQIADVITYEADRDRIENALIKALKEIRGGTDRNKYYRGFVGYVGVTPTLRERKVVTEAKLGILQNRSVRLAIEYWRKTPGCQMCALTINRNETFSSRNDELIEYWEGFDFKPWEIGVFEAQNYYSKYWSVPIAEGLLPPVIPVMLRKGSDQIEILDPKEEIELLMKIGKMSQRGEVEKTLQSMGVAFRSEGIFDKGGDYEKFVEGMQKELEVVDEKHPELTRPDEAVKHEDFVPDKAEPAKNEDWRRMAFNSRKR